MVMSLMVVEVFLEAPRAAGIAFAIVNDVEAVDHLGDIELELTSTSSSGCSLTAPGVTLTARLGLAGRFHRH